MTFQEFLAAKRAAAIVEHLETLSEAEAIEILEQLDRATLELIEAQNNNQHYERETVRDDWDNPERKMDLANVRLRPSGRNYGTPAMFRANRPNTYQLNPRIKARVSKLLSKEMGRSQPRASRVEKIKNLVGPGARHLIEPGTSGVNESKYIRDLKNLFDATYGKNGKYEPVEGDRSETTGDTHGERTSSLRNELARREAKKKAERDADYFYDPRKHGPRP